MKEDESDKPLNVKRTTTQRLRMANGHLIKVVEMSEKGAQSLDVLQQLSAVISALKSCSVLLVLEHAGSQISDGKPINADEFLRDLESILERSMR